MRISKGELWMFNFVLTHGSWHTGAHWTPVVRHLHQAGHQAFAPTVLGHGEGVEKRVNHVQQVDDLVNQLIQRNLHDIVLVGHSYAGTLTARLAEEIPDRIRRLVFWNAFVPRRGNCFLDEMPPHYRTLFVELAAASSDGTVMLPYPICRQAFIHDAHPTLAKPSSDTPSP